MFPKPLFLFLLLMILNTTVGNTKSLTDLEAEIESVEKNKSFSIISNYQNEISKWNQEDQGRYYTLKGLSLENSNIELAEQSYNKSIEILESLDFTSEHLINALIERSYIYYLNSNDTKHYCPDRLKALKLARKTNEFKETLARALVQYSFCFDGKQDKFPKALKLLEEAMQVAKQNKLNLPLIYNATAILYRTNNIYEKSYDYFTKAYQGWEKQKDIQDMFNMQHSLLNISLKMGNIERAKKHLEIIHKLTQENPDFSDFLFFYYFNSGLVSLQENNYVKAIEKFTNALKLRETTHEKYYIKLGLANLAISNFRINNIEAAKNQALEFISLNAESNTLNNKKILMDMIIKYSENHYWQAINQMWNYIDHIEKDKIKFLLNSSKAQSLIFDKNINKFENKILAQENDIKNLMLTSEKRKNKIAILTISIIAVFSLTVLLFTFSLWRSKKKFVRLAQIDFLTKIANRRTIFETGQLLIDQSIKKGQSLSLFVFDIDDFKIVNDIHGHDIGDKVLKTLAKACQQELPDNCLFGRFGGEEFLYLIPNLSESEALRVAARVKTKVSQINFLETTQALNITISTGISNSTKDIQMDDFIKQADLAMYESKNNGKNTVTVYKA